MKVEIIERKGIGHPDTICDNLAEELAKTLKQEYINQYGKVMHYNVDKVLASCGKIDYKKRKMIDPVKIVFSGNATPIKFLNKILKTVVEKVLSLEIKRGLDYEIFNHIAECSPDLTSNFDEKKCNDTSFAVGFPLSKTEKLVLKMAEFIENMASHNPGVGTDYKIMYINGDIFIAQAFISINTSDYNITKELYKKAFESKFKVKIHLNTGDNELTVFNTITGTSLEQGDAGMVGRGNRRNGLITPLKPMTMEAYYGKNDITHNGRIYQDVAQRIADKKRVPVLIVNNIGNNIEDYTLIEGK